MPGWQASLWPACAQWSREYMQTAFGSNAVVVGEMSMQLADYLSYLDGAHDEMPLYLFDKAFVEKAPILQSGFEVTHMHRYPSIWPPALYPLPCHCCWSGIS